MYFGFDLGNAAEPTFADATTTHPTLGRKLRTYILARFDGKTSFDWVARLRGVLAKSELKYRDLVSNGIVLVPSTEVWRALESGVGDASIFIVEPDSYARRLTNTLFEAGAEYGIDFAWGDIINAAAEEIVGHTPAYKLPDLLSVHPTAVGWSGSWRIGKAFAPRRTMAVTLHPVPPPAALLKEIGGKLRDAVTFAARAYSALDFASAAADLDTMPFAYLDSPIFSSRLQDARIAAAFSTPHVFDTEHKKSAIALNRIVHHFRRAVPIGFAFAHHLARAEELVREEDSRAIDGLQAADIAAGVAREIVERQGIRALLNRFRRVVLNGVDLAQAMR